MYLHILRSYVNSINDGAVPNIETAWTYMCQEKCMKTYENCLELFEDEISELISNGLPIAEE